MLDPIRDHGIVGAGGGGFPTHVKYGRKVGTLLVNAAECEPLLHKDKELLLHHTDAFWDGLNYGMKRLDANEAIIGVKKKYTDVIDALSAHLPAGVRICPLGDFYPAGDEFCLVYETTGRVIPPGGLPLDVDVVCNNVETFVNIGRNKPVTHKYLTVAGAVENPVTVRVPIGAPLRVAIEMAGGATIQSYWLLTGGVMMGRIPANGEDEPITKTTGGLYVLPDDHPLLAKYRCDWKSIRWIARAACDQCSYCTERCPRYLLGHPIEPHKAMRALGFMPDNQKEGLFAGTLYCCECNLCSFIACPENLDPKNVCVFYKQNIRELGGPKEKNNSRGVHPLQEARRTPLSMLINKLALRQFRNTGPLTNDQPKVDRVVLPLRQHVGAPAVATVRRGDNVREGDLIGEIPEGKLGARVHASIDGVVAEVGESIVIEAR